MAGEAKTNLFLLNTATVMIGQTTDVLNLNSSAHSIGLVKNFKVVATPTYTQLTQGVSNTIVDSTLTANPVQATMDVFEYSAKNLKYALGLDGSTVTSTGLSYSPNGSVAPAATTFVVATTDLTSLFAAGDYCEITEGDNAHIVKLSAVAFSTNSTLTFAGYATPAGLTFTTAAKLRKILMIPVGSKTSQPYLSAKVVSGVLQDSAPIVLVFPKVRISKGFSLDFQTGAYSSMPFEFTPYDLTSSDTAYGLFATNDLCQVIRPVA